MNKNEKIAAGVTAGVALIALKLNRDRRKKNLREANEALEKVGEALTELWVNLEFNRIISNY